MVLLNWKKRIMVPALVLALTGTLLGFTLRYLPTEKTFGYADAGKISVIVDAGHGDPDGGTVGTSGTVEKDINLAIAQKLQEVLEGKGIRVVMTREGDSGLQDAGATTIREMKRSDMNKRLDIMKKSNADLFLSIHMNSFANGSVNGLHIFYAKNHAEMEPLADNIQNRMGQITGAKVHAVKTADSNLFLMKDPPLPAILVECGFLSNPEEEKKLSDDDYQARIAWAIGDAVEDYYQEQLFTK